MGLRLGSTRIPGITLYEEGKVYPQGLTEIDATVPPVVNKCLVTIESTGDASSCYVRYPGQGGTAYYTEGDTFEVNVGDTIYAYASATRTIAEIYLNGVRVAGGDTSGMASYNYQITQQKNISINLFYGTSSYIRITEVTPTDYDVSDYAFAKVSGIPEPVDYFAQYATDTLVSYSNSTITSLPDFAFYFRENLEGVNFPACTTIGGNTFAYCYSLSQVSFPACTSIGNNAFYSCLSLTSVSFPVCSSIGQATFSGTALTSVNFPVCTIISAYAFYSCLSLTTVDFPSCTTIGVSAFARCLSLTTASFSSCQTIGNYAFANCQSLSQVDFPSCTTIGGYAFQSCRSLTMADFSACTTIGQSAFYRCYNLLALYLMGSSLCSLANTNAFTSTPISNYTTSTGGVYGSIYVPASLLASYQAATNWVNYSSRFVGLQIE